jgi:hypothetical protein
MNSKKFDTEQRARMVNGDVVRYDRLEEHGEHRIFFRGKIGIVYAAFKDSVITYNENQNEQAA